MSSGVAVHDDCVAAFMDLKLKKKIHFIMYRISDDYTTIVIDKMVDKEHSSYQHFVDQFPADDCRYAVCDFEYETNEGLRNKICFYVWAPDNARIKSKMLYASSKDALRKKLIGIASEVQGTDLSEVDYETVLKRVNPN